MGRFRATAIALLLLGACQTQTHAVFSPVPSPSPHTATTDAILQPGDVPAGLAVCPGSGPIDVYITVLAQTDQALAGRVADEWARLRGLGATSGAMAIYAASVEACTSEVGAAGGVKAATSFVARFSDAAQANQAWLSGVFGFQPPPAGEVAPGLTGGSSTGLGPSSFTYDRPSVRLASWQRSVFVALVVVSNLDPTAFSAATAAIDPRLN